MLPGYRQAESFGPDEEYEGEEEVEYVTLDLGSGVEPTLVPSSETYRLIGLDSPTPFLQLSGTIFKGQHKNLLGTELLFTDEHDIEPSRPHHIANIGISERRIKFKEVQLKPKTSTVIPATSTSSNHESMYPIAHGERPAVSFVSTKEDTNAGAGAPIASTSSPERGSVRQRGMVTSRGRGGRKGKDKGKAKEKGKGKGKEKEMDMDVNVDEVEAAGGGEMSMDVDVQGAQAMSGDVGLDREGMDVDEMGT